MSAVAVAAAPYTHGGAPAVQGTPAFPRASGSPTTSASIRGAVPSAYAKRGPLGDPTPLVCTVAKESLQIALGAHGIDYLARWITPTLRTSLLRQQSLSRRAGYTARGEVSVVRVRLCRVSATAVEAAVVTMEGEAAHALAMRLEAVSGRWLVTALDVG